MVIMINIAHQFDNCGLKMWNTVPFAFVDGQNLVFSVSLEFLTLRRIYRYIDIYTDRPVGRQIL